MPFGMEQLNSEEILSSIAEMRTNKMWMENKLEELIEKYPNKFIAIFKQKVVGSDSDYKTLIKTLKKQYKNINMIAIEFIVGDDY